MIRFQFLKPKLSGNNVEIVEMTLVETSGDQLQFVLEIESGIRFENRLKRLKIEMKRVNCEKDEFEEKVKRMTYEYEKINEF